MKVIPFEILLLSTAVAASLAPPGGEFDTGRRVHQERLGHSGSAHGTGGGRNIGETITRSGRPYQCFEGTEYSPSSDEWLPFEHLWKINHELILSQNGGNTYIEHYIKESILQVADEAHVDARLILVLLLQQSRGRASIGCALAISRCGLLQTPHGLEVVDKHNPQDSVRQMIEEGVQGVRTNGVLGHPAWGLAHHLKKHEPENGVSPNKPYAALAAYEFNLRSISTPPKGKILGLTQFIDDIANRLVGWNGRNRKGC